MARIRDIFFDPPIAVARLGGSSQPQVAYEWAQSVDPRVEGETSVRATWSLRVLADGNIEPFKPTRIDFRDGPLIRPVCPFFELWAVVGDSADPATWTEVPLTPALLKENKASLADLSFTIDARNRKAERRTGRPELAFGTWPAVVVRADDHTPQPLLGRSPPGLARPMIPPDRNIPLGSFRVLRSTPQTANAEVNVEVIRCRFTPAAGRMYGPDSAKEPSPNGSRPVDPARAFLDGRARWKGAITREVVSPGDTFDGAETNRDAPYGPSAGVVDDTCEARIEARLRFGPAPRRELVTRANVFVGPPDYAPDRRPFLSVADDLNDRIKGQELRSKAMTADERTAWVQDLFERVFETVSMLNVDRERSGRGLAFMAGDARLGPPILGDGVARQRSAMGGRDALRNRDFTIAADTTDAPLPLSQHAKTRHRALSDVNELRNFVAQRPGRLRKLVRRVFECEPGEEDGSRTTMRMPPFMRASNALPLTLTAWQYDTLMAWVDDVESGGAAVAAAAPRALSAAAEERRRQVLSRIG